jgi:hypothetical protein
MLHSEDSIRELELQSSAQAPGDKEGPDEKVETQLQDVLNEKQKLEKPKVRKTSSFGGLFAAAAPEIQAQERTYRIKDGFEIGLRVEPDMKSAKTGKVLRPGETFKVTGRQVAERTRQFGGGDQTWLKVGSDGWAFEYHPSRPDTLCELWTAPSPRTSDADIDAEGGTSPRSPTLQKMDSVSLEDNPVVPNIKKQKSKIRRDSLAMARSARAAKANQAGRRESNRRESFLQRRRESVVKSVMKLPTWLFNDGAPVEEVIGKGRRASIAIPTPFLAQNGETEYFKAAIPNQEEVEQVAEAVKQHTKAIFRNPVDWLFAGELANEGMSEEDLLREKLPPGDAAAEMYIDEHGMSRYRASESGLAVNQGLTGVVISHDAEEELLAVKQAETKRGGDWHTDLEEGWYLVHSGWMRQWLSFVTKKGPPPGEISNLDLLTRKMVPADESAGAAGAAGAAKLDVKQSPVVVDRKRRQSWLDVQRYRVHDGFSLQVRAAPSADAAPTGATLSPGDVFEVSEVRADDAVPPTASPTETKPKRFSMIGAAKSTKQPAVVTQTWLKVVADDGGEGGWIFLTHPATGEPLCVREGAGHHLLGSASFSVRNDMMLKQDFRAVSEDVWAVLHGLYGGWSVYVPNHFHGRAVSESQSKSGGGKVGGEGLMERMMQPDNLVPNALVESPTERKLRGAAVSTAFASSLAAGKLARAKQALEDADNEEARRQAQAEIENARALVLQSAWRARKARQELEARRESKKETAARERQWRAEREAKAKEAVEEEKRRLAEARRAETISQFAAQGVKGKLRLMRQKRMEMRDDDDPHGVRLEFCADWLEKLLGAEGLRELENGLATMMQCQWRARAARREYAKRCHEMIDLLEQFEEIDPEVEKAKADAEEAEKAEEAEESAEPPTLVGWLYKLSVDKGKMSLVNTMKNVRGKQRRYFVLSKQVLSPQCLLHTPRLETPPSLCSLHPAPFTLLPSPYSLHPTPSTLLPPLPYSLHPTPSTTLLPPPCSLHPAPSTYSLHPAPSTLLPPPYSLHSADFLFSLSLGFFAPYSRVCLHTTWRRPNSAPTPTPTSTTHGVCWI